MKLFFSLFFLIFSYTSSASHFTIDQIFDSNYFNFSNPVKRTWSNEDLAFIESSSEDGVFKLEQRFAHNNEKGGELSASDILPLFRQFEGLSDLKEADIGSPTISHMETHLLFSVKDDLFTYELARNILKRLTYDSKKKTDLSFSSNDKLIAYVEENNLWVMNIENNQTWQVTSDGDDHILNGKLDWVYQEEIYGRGQSKAYWWSKDDKYIAFLRTDTSAVGKFPIVDHTQLYASVDYTSYPKAGSKNPRVDLGLYHLQDQTQHWADLSKYDPEDMLIVGVGFSSDFKFLNFQIQDRKQKSLDLNLLNLYNFEQTTLLREESTTWVSRLQEEPIWKGSDFYWLSSRTGYTHLYKFTAEDSNLLNFQESQLTSGKWSIKEINHISSSGNIYFTANKDSLLEDHLYYLDEEKESEITRLTDLGFDHNISISKHAEYLIDNFSSINQAPQESLYRIKDGKSPFLEKIRDLWVADTSFLDSLDLPKPEFVEVNTRDGVKLNAMIIKPNILDESIKHPVLNYTYSGPGNQSVRNSFQGSFYLWHQYLAAHGIVIWVCDNRSSSGLGKVTENTSYLNLGKQELEDLEDGIGYLKQFTWVDQSNIAMWGWSFGGFMSAYALTHSQVFKAAIAVAPVTDWKLYDSVYTERYMMTPEENPIGYEQSSVLTSAQNLHGSLFLVHGTLDDNVHDQNTIKLALELQKNELNFEMMSYAESKHGIRSPELRKHLFKKMSAFLFKSFSENS